MFFLKIINFFLCALRNPLLSICVLKIFYILKVLSFAFSHLWIPNLEFIFVCGVRCFYLFIFELERKWSMSSIAWKICYAKVVWHKRCLHTHVLLFLSFADRYFYPQADNQIRVSAPPDSGFSTTTYWWRDQLDCGTFQGPLVEKILLESWVLCVRAECCWWSQRTRFGAFCVLRESTLWASVRAHSDSNPRGAAKQPELCEESLPGRCCWGSVTSVTKIW